MTYQDVNSIIAGIGLPYAYYQFPDYSGQDPPFICFFYEGSDDLYADDVNYQRIRPLHIELYTAGKDFQLEERIEEALTSAGLAYTREESYIGSEQMFQITFSTEVVINGQEQS